MSDLRKRVWVFELYPDSMPEHSIELLHTLHIPIAMSPLHDKDTVDLEDIEDHPDYYSMSDFGKEKKPHYHLIIGYDGKKSRENVLDDLSKLGVSYVKPCSCCSSYYRYLCHLDNPEKHRYSLRDITLFAGFNPDNYIKESCDVYIPDMMTYLNEHPEHDFASFCMYCLEFKDESDPETGEYLNHWEWYLVLTKVKTQLFIAFIKSLHSRKVFKGDDSN